MSSAAIVTSALCVNIIKIQRLCIDIFFVSPWKQVLWALVEGLLMSTHNVYFCGNIPKIYICYPRLSRAMLERENWLEEECMEKERTRHVRKTKTQERLCTYACWSVCLFVWFGLNVAFNLFQSYRDGVWMWQGAQCSLLECCLTEISRPRHFDMIFHPVTLYWHWADQF